jgi:hypothetical protein
MFCIGLGAVLVGIPVLGLRRAGHSVIPIQRLHPRRFVSLLLVLNFLSLLFVTIDVEFDIMTAISQ